MRSALGDRVYGGFLRGFVAVAGGLTVSGALRAEDLFLKFSHTQHPAVVEEASPTGASDASSADVCADGDVLAAPQVSTYVPERGDLAQFFPNLRMPPILASTPDAATGDTAASRPGQRDFASIVREAQREAMADARRGSGSIASKLPSDPIRPGTSATFASAAWPHCRPGRQQQQCPPGQRSTMPQQPSQSMPVVPLPDALGMEATVPPVPDLRQQMQPNANQFARSDVSSMRTNYSDSPVLVGDGMAPQSSGGQLALSRLLIQSSGLTVSGSTLSGNNPAQLYYFQPADADYNNIQKIAQNYPSYPPPTVLGSSVPGTPPTILQGSPGPGTIQTPPATYQTTATTQFEDPSLGNPLPTHGLSNGTATYVQGASGTVTNGSNTQDAFLFYDYVVDSSVIFPGFAVGFVKITENMSPIPRDRVYMNYSYFHNANFFGTRADVNRFMPGFEKTFYDGWTSVEIRTPFAATLDNVQSINYQGPNAQISEYRDLQFGNMSVIFKTLIFEQKTWAITSGVQVMLPTANNTSVYAPYQVNGSVTRDLQLLYVANESVHVMPFVGGIWAPNERFFNQALLQIDRDANGNLAYLNTNQDPTLTGRNLTGAGRVFYPTFMYLSLGTGYWLYKNDNARFTGFSPIMEIHVNQAFEDFQPLHFQSYTLGTNPGVVSVTNGLLGCNFEWGTRSTLTFAYVTPFGGGADRFFDGELRALFNWRFGPQTRLTRAQL